MLVKRMNGLHTLFTEVGKKEINKIVFYNGKNEIAVHNSDARIEYIEADRKIKEPVVRIGNYVWDGVLYVEAKDINIVREKNLRFTDRYQTYVDIMNTIELVKPFTNYKEEEQRKIIVNRSDVIKTEIGKKLKKFAEDFEISETKAQKIIEAYSLF